ncbi:DUF3575 domain-containing protein [Dysgonomonas alginatilytica]|uniref:DUF3575 domain-containing protein n=1 Tax=Dysgonomonas alginatilytica TaxID=1605892 RepID=UPI00374213FA
MNMTKRLLFLSLILIIAINTYGQSEKSDYYAPTWALKTNALYLATTTLNIGVEMGLSKKLTLDVSGNYNPWNLGSNKKLKHFLVQPELRYWLCERFNGHFFGLHAHYGQFNVGGISMLGLDKYRYEGDLYGAGISYGYHWILNKRWSIEATIGLGYAYLDYSKFDCGECGSKIKDDTRHYWGPTKAGISLIYILK